MADRLIAFSLEYIDGNRDVADVRREFGLTKNEVDWLGTVLAQTHEELGIDLADSMASTYLQGFETGYRWRDVFPPS